MARVSKIETCMFCGVVPCVCDKPADKPKPARKAKPKADTPAVAEEIVPENVPAQEDPWAASTAPKPSPFAKMGFVHASVSLKEHVEERNEDDELMTSEQAWSNIHDILGPHLDRDSQLLVKRKAGNFPTPEQTERLKRVKGEIREVG